MDHEGDFIGSLVSDVSDVSDVAAGAFRDGERIIGQRHEKGQDLIATALDVLAEIDFGPRQAGDVLAKPEETNRFAPEVEAYIDLFWNSTSTPSRTQSLVGSSPCSKLRSSRKQLSWDDANRRS